MTTSLADEIRNLLKIKNEGGPGSGNFGHQGRPGQLGGSGPGGRVDISSLKLDGSGIKYEELKSGGAKTSKKLQDYASKMSSEDIHSDLKSLGIDSSGMSRLPEGVQQEVYAAIAHSYLPYENSIPITKIDTKIRGRVPMKVDTDLDTGLKTIQINKNIMNDPRFEKGWAKEVMDHEIGHVLGGGYGSDYIDEAGKAHYAAQVPLLMQDKFTDNKRLKKAFISEQISPYASSKTNEMIPEAWRQRQNGTESPLAKQVNELTLKKLEKPWKFTKPVKKVYDPKTHTMIPESTPRPEAPKPQPRPEAPKPLKAPEAPKPTKTLLERVEERMNRPKTLLERVEERIAERGGL